MVYDVEPLILGGGGVCHYQIQQVQSQVGTRQWASPLEQEGRWGKGRFKGKKTWVMRDREPFCPSLILVPPVMTLPATQSWNSKFEAHLSYVLLLPCQPYVICSHFWNLTCGFSQIWLLCSVSQPCPSCLSASAKLFPYLKFFHLHLILLYSVFLYILRKMSPPLGKLPLCPALCTEDKATSYCALIYLVCDAGIVSSSLL